MDGKDSAVGGEPEEARARQSGSSGWLWSSGLFAVVCAGFLLWWLWMALRYPYFYLADMDLLAPCEALNINSGAEPWVTQHPGYGMYVFDAFTLRVAALWGQVSVVDYPSLEKSLSPLLVMAELTSFFRLHSPILVFVIALSLWATVVRVGRFSALLSVLIFAGIASSEGLAYHAAMIRVDLYSAFFWSLSLPVAAAAASSRRPAAHGALLILTGFLLGLAFLTKIQSGVHLAAAPLVYWLTRSLRDPGPVSAEDAGGSRRTWFFLAAVNVCALAALLIAARYTVSQQFKLFGIDENPGTYAGAPSRRAVAVAVGALLLFAMQVSWPAKWRVLAALPLAARTATPAVTGGILAILSPLVLYRDPSTGIRFALHNLQNLLWTELFFFRAEESTETVLIEFSRYRWWLVAALGAAAVLATVAAVAARPRRVWTTPPIVAAWMVFAASVSLVVVRTAPRDVLWFDTAYVLAAFMLLALAVRAAKRWRRGITAAAAGIALFVSGENLVRLSEFSSRMDANYHIYGWTEMPWFDYWFLAPRYEQLMTARYPEGARAPAARQAREHFRLRTMVRHIFQNADVTLANVGPLVTGQPLWRNHREWVVSGFPRGYASSHVVDTLEMTLKPRYFFSHVSKLEEWLDRVVPAPAQARGAAPTDPIRALSILPRRDIEVVLFAGMEDLARAAAAEASLKIPSGTDAPLEIVVRRGGEERRLSGAILPLYTVLPVADFVGPYVFVVRERTLPAAYGSYLQRGASAGPQREVDVSGLAPSKDHVSNDAPAATP